MTVTVKDAVRFYYDNIGREYMAMDVRWVLSTATVTALFKQSMGRDPKKDELKSDGNMLCGIPIRIDDSVEGLSYERY